MTHPAIGSLLTALAPLSFAWTARAGESAVFLGIPGSVGDVRAFDAATAGAAHPVAGLDGIRLLPLDFAGHSAGDELSPRFPRQRLDIPGAARLALQNGHGSLYRFARQSAAGDAYGFFVVDASGTRILHQRPVPAGAPDPFVPTVAVSGDGAAILIATLPAAGGDLYEISVATGSTTLRTPSQGPLDFGPHGLALGAQSGFAAHTAGVLRFVRGQSGGASDVTFPSPAPTWFSRELVLSQNGSYAATIAGLDPTQASVFALGDVGVATNEIGRAHV
jgi:hypothetical protein